MLFYFSKFINCFYGTDFIRLREKNENKSCSKKITILQIFKNWFCWEKSKNFFVFENQDSSMQKILKKSDGI